MTQIPMSSSRSRTPLGDASNKYHQSSPIQFLPSLNSTSSSQIKSQSECLEGVTSQIKKLQITFIHKDLEERPTFLNPPPSTWESPDGIQIPTLYILNLLPKLATSHFLNPQNSTHYLSISDLNGVLMTINPITGRPSREDPLPSPNELNIPEKARLLFPIHDIFIMLNCANVPKETFLNASSLSPCMLVKGKGLVSWQVPCPYSFPILLEWIYFRSKPKLEFSIKSMSQRWMELPNHKYSSNLDAIKDIVRGISKNASALGVYNYPQISTSNSSNESNLLGFWDLLDDIWHHLHLIAKDSLTK